MNITYRYRSVEDTPYRGAHNNDIHTRVGIMRIGDETTVQLDCHTLHIGPCERGKIIEPINLNRYRFAGQVKDRFTHGGICLIVDCGIPIRISAAPIDFNVRDCEYIEFVGDLYGDYGADASQLYQQVKGQIVDIVWDNPEDDPLILMRVTEIHEIERIWELYG